MTGGLRRIAFSLGALLLAGGFGLTRFLDAHQHAAGAEAGAWWRQGVRETTIGDLPATLIGADGQPAAPATREVVRHVTPPTWSLYYLASVAAMASGAGVMALSVPWRNPRRQVGAVPVAPAAPAASMAAGPSAAPAPARGAAAPARTADPSPSAAKPIRFKRGA